MAFEITIRSYNDGNILKLIVDTSSIEVIIGHIKNLKSGHDVLKVKKIIPIVDIDHVVVRQ